MANCWLEEGQNFFYNGIRALEKRWTRCISVAKEYLEKVAKDNLNIFCLTLPIYELFE